MNLHWPLLVWLKIIHVVLKPCFPSFHHLIYNIVEFGFQYWVPDVLKCAWARGLCNCWGFQRLGRWQIFHADLKRKGVEVNLARGHFCHRLLGHPCGHLSQPRRQQWQLRCVPCLREMLVKDIIEVS
jgi:hypothetical protein